MLANYGYKDGSGEYFITIDTDKCTTCPDHGCVAGCPEHVYQIITDDYDDEVAEVKKDVRNTLKYLCASCKPTSGRVELPCRASCTPGALSHSW